MEANRDLDPLETHIGDFKNASRDRMAFDYNGGTNFGLAASSGNAGQTGDLDGCKSGHQAPRAKAV